MILPQEFLLLSMLISFLWVKVVVKDMVLVLLVLIQLQLMVQPIVSAVVLMI